MEIIQRITVGAFMIGIVWGGGFQLWSLLTQIGSEYCGFGSDLQCKYGAITIRKRLRQTKSPRTRQPFRCELKMQRLLSAGAGLTNRCCCLLSMLQDVAR